MIIQINGDLGTGKTCIMTKYALDYFKMGRKIISNYKLNNIPYEKLDIVDIYLNKPDLKNIVILGDELYTFMDCRTAMSQRNRLESYFIAQTRKRNCDVVFTSQYEDFIDFRLIRFVNINIDMENIWVYSKSLEMSVKHPYLFLVSLTDYRQSKNIKHYKKIFDGRNYFNEYNTEEQIYPPEEIFKTLEDFRKKRNKSKQT